MPRSLADGPLEQEDPGETDPIVTVNYNSENGKIQYLGSYSVGASNPDGGVAEIVKYNSDNPKDVHCQWTGAADRYCRSLWAQRWG